MPGDTDGLTRNPCHTMAPLTLYQYFCLPFKRTLQQSFCENEDSSELRAVAGEVESKQEQRGVWGRWRGSLVFFGGTAYSIISSFFPLEVYNNPSEML